MDMNVRILKKFLFGAVLLTGLSAVTVSYASDGGILVPCETSGGAVIFPVSSHCDYEPDTYSITIYQLGLCTSAPTAPDVDSVAGLSSCTTVYNNPAGATISVSTAAPVVLSGGTVTVPPAGTYAYGYVILANTIRVATSITFTTPRTGQVGGTSGPVCWTVDQSLLRYDPFTNTSQCDSSVGPVGTLTVLFNTLAGEALIYSGSETIPETGDLLTAYLLESTGFILRNNIDEPSTTANRILGVLTFLSPVIVPAQPVSFDIAFRTSSGLGINSEPSTGKVKFDPGPFFFKITVN